MTWIIVRYFWLVYFYIFFFFLFSAHISGEGAKAKSMSSTALSQRKQLKWRIKYLVWLCLYLFSFFYLCWTRLTVLITFCRWKYKNWVSHYCEWMPCTGHSKRQSFFGALWSLIISNTWEQLNVFRQCQITW